jgi:hypothetical protein
VNFHIHAQLFDTIQKTVDDETHGFLDRITHIHNSMQQFEDSIITKTKDNISMEQQEAGQLVKRSPQDAIMLNELSGQFFALINDICRATGLASKVPVLPSNSFKSKRDDVIREKIMPGIASIAITKQIDDTVKRARSVSQRINLLMKAIIGACIRYQTKKAKSKYTPTWSQSISINIQRFRKQQDLFIQSMIKTVNTCIEIKEERAKHIEAIETSRNKKMYDSDLQYLDEVIAIQGREEYTQFINQMKRDILGSNTYTGSNTDLLDKKT